MEFKISDLWSVLKKVFLIMLIGGLVAGVCAYVFSSVFGKEAYSSSAQFFLEPNKAEIDVKDYTSYIVYCKGNVKEKTKTELAMKNLLDYLDQMHIKDPTNKDYQLDSHYSPAGLIGRCSISMASGEYEAYFKVSFTADSAHDAYVLLKAYAATCNEQGKTVYADNLVIKPTVENFRLGVQTAPHPMRNAALAFLLVAVAVYFAAFLVSVLDTRLYSAADLRQYFGQYPILGQIPLGEVRPKTNASEEETSK